jgi:hypothetical protein
MSHSAGPRNVPMWVAIAPAMKRQIVCGLRRRPSWPRQSHNHPVSSEKIPQGKNSVAPHRKAPRNATTLGHAGFGIRPQPWNAHRKTGLCGSFIGHSFSALALHSDTAATREEFGPCHGYGSY